MPAAGIKKYYIGLAVLMVLAVGAVVYTASQGGSAKADAKTDKAVDDISTKLESYISDNDNIPDSLQTAGVSSVPPTVTYTKLGDTKYKICFDYKNSSNGFDASWGSLLGGALTAGQQTDTTSSQDTSYFDTTVEFSHKKGENCQTITPYIFSSGSSGTNYSGTSSSSGSSSSSSSSSACDADTSAYPVSGFVTISSIDTASNQLNFSSDGQYVSDTGGNSLPVIASKDYDLSTLVCDSNENQTTAAALKAGQTIVIYMTSASASNLSRIDISY